MHLEMSFKTLLPVVSALLLLTDLPIHAEALVWFDGTRPITYTVSKHTDPVVTTALEMFKDDMRQVTGMTPKASSHGTIRIIQGKGDADGFRIHVDNKQIVVEGTNGRGTAYGLLELSRMAGVSPWIWWGDVKPEKRNRLTISKDFHTEQRPSVEYRGIFINDEDWSTRTWSSIMESLPYGQIGVETYRRIFQLLLRLRANTIWPAMHPGTTAFFKLAGAKSMADSCGIIIGTSHCEPMLRNNVDEWDKKSRGAFNYRTNKQAVLDYWTERLKEVKGSSNNMFTIGMRGIHDSSMEGYQTEKEKFDGLQQVIDDQQELLRRHIASPSQLMQVFVPYKEVLQLYEKGLRVPDYVTLMWCDDNYGYMTRLSDSDEQFRSGGGGVYYHLSYWGRPHDYLWLTTTQPGLIYNEMRQAYDHHVRKLWIANVHDPKVAGYDLELFLDLAWNIEAVNETSLSEHYKSWLRRQFGEQAGDALFPIMHEFYRLCGERRPEFMGWNQVELDKKLYDRGLGQVRNTAFNLLEFSGELDRQEERFEALSRQVEKIEGMVRAELRDAYFAAILYPVQAAAAHCVKMLEAQRARQLADGSTDNMPEREKAVKQAAAKSMAAYLRIQQLTDHYNNMMTDGKWKGSMNDHPRDLPVFWAPLLPVQVTEEEMSSTSLLPTLSHPLIVPPNVIARDAHDYDKAAGHPHIREMLGHSMRAVALEKDDCLSYHIHIQKEGDYVLTIAMIPTQPTNNGDLRFSVSVDASKPIIYSLKEPFRSERWKENVLRGQAIRQETIHLTTGEHTLTIQALDDHIVADQWMLDILPNRKHYLFPVKR